MRASLSFFVTLTLAFALSQRAVAADEAGQPATLLDRLQGSWEMTDPRTSEFTPRLHLRGDSRGYWQRSAKAPNVRTSYFVDGDVLLLQYYERSPNTATEQLRQRRFRVTLEAEQLTLTEGEQKTTWRRRRLEEAAIANNDFTLRETFLADNQSLFDIDAHTGDGQLGIAVMIEVAKLAEERGFTHFVPLHGEESQAQIWIAFYRDDPREKLKPLDVAVFEVAMLRQLQGK